MSLKQPQVPLIAVTPEAEEDDDVNYMNLADALTDLEDVELEASEEAPRRKVIHKKRPKLKIKIRDSDDGLTDLEDVEASDNEDHTEIVKHKQPINLDDLDLTGDIYTESYKMGNQIFQGGSQGIDGNESGLLGVDETGIEGGITDVENYAASSPDEEDEGKYPEVDLSSEMFTEGDCINTKEDVKRTLQPAPSPMVTPCVSEDEAKSKSKLKKHINVYKNANRLSAGNIHHPIRITTDVESLDSDESEDDDKNQLVKKERRRKRCKRPKGSLRNRGGVTDIEDVNVSGEDTSTTRFKFKTKVRGIQHLTKLNLPNLKVVCTQYSLCESDVEDDDVKVKTKPKPKVPNVSLTIPVNEDEGVTDVEDFEADQQISDDDEQESDKYEIDSALIDQQLEELGDCYSSVVDHEDKKVDNSVNIENAVISIRGPSLEDQNETDSDNFDHDDADLNQQRGNEGSSLMKTDPSIENLNVHFYGRKNKNKKSKNKKQITKNQNQNQMLGVVENEEGVTDLENLDSSQESENEEIPVALIKPEDTEEEEEEEELGGESDLNDLLDDGEELNLPPSLREMVVIKTNKSSGKPEVNVMPLENNVVLGLLSIPRQDEGALTDVENFSGEDDVNFEENDKVSDYDEKDFDYDELIPDAGFTETHENVREQGRERRENNIREVLTDTEDIPLFDNNRKNCYKRKEKHQQTSQQQKFGNTLTVNVKTKKNRSTGGDKTDTEDLCLSDQEASSSSKIKLKLTINNSYGNDALTDVENMDMSDDSGEEGEGREGGNKRRSCTPQHMRELGGETVMSKEGSGSFTEGERLAVQNNRFANNQSSKSPTPNPTDEEDMGEEEGDDKNKAMYLKGGGFSYFTPRAFHNIQQHFFRALNNNNQDIDNQNVVVEVNVRDGVVSYESGIRRQQQQQHPPDKQPSPKQH